MKLGRKSAATLLIFFIVIIVLCPTTALAEEKSRVAVLIVMDRINLEDLQDCPNIQKLINNGALGLMNIRTAGRYDADSGYLSIGAGTRASSLEGGKKIYQFGETVEGEKAEILFENFTGIKPREGNIMVLDLPSLISENKKHDYEIIPGLLGEVLEKNNLQVILLGDGDIPQEQNRAAALLAMNQAGLVQQGEVGPGITTRDTESPFLIKTDYKKLLDAFIKYQKQEGLIIIHLGDLLRADILHEKLSNSRSLAFRAKALINADKFIGRVIERINLNNDLLILVTPFPSINGYNKRNLLTPFIIAGKGITPGLTNTPTTRRAGILANVDVAPTILAYFSLEMPSIILGHPISSVSGDNTYATMLELEQQITSTFIQRAFLIKPFVALQIIISLGFLIFFFRKKKWLKYLKPLILASMSIPVALLYLSLPASNSLTAKYGWLLFFTALFAVILMQFKETLGAVYFISLITGLSILLDLFLDSPLMKVSALGYDPIGGSRYYGLGNEYMGVLIGSLIIGTTSLLDKVKADKRGVFFTAVLFSIAFYLILSPRFGSNVGGTISAFGAFTITLLFGLNIKLRVKHIILLGGGLLILLLILFLVIGQLGPPSHISKTVDLIKEGGLSSIIVIFSRKLSMNYKLLRYTVWTRALLASIAVIAALLYRPPYFLQKIFSKNKYLYSGFIGTGIGCLLALIFNDSGIVAAATMMIFIALPVMLLVIEEIGT